MTHFERAHHLQTEPSTFTEPFSGAPGDRQYGAMPAHPFRDDRVRKRQAFVETEFFKLFTPPAELNVPDSFVTFFQDDYVIGERRRQMTNYNNYMDWRAAQPDIPKELAEQIDHYEAGTAEVDEIFDIMLNTTITKGLEVGRVTHPYWQRMQHLAPLREAVASAVVARGGTLEPRHSPYYSIGIIPSIIPDELGNQRIRGHLARYKHDIASFVRPLDGKIVHVVERQIAGIRVDEASGFSQGVQRRMHEVADAKEKFRWDNVHDERFEYHLRDTGCRGFIEKAIQTDSTDAYIVPESTTVYAFAEDPETSKAMGGAALAGGRARTTPYYAV
ncbi:MAG: hypothetical protein ACO1N2_01245 [Candidatus Saccharimonadota bacterium]